MEKEEKIKNLYQRLRDIMLEVKYVKKESKLVNNQYTFVSHDAVTAALHDPLAKHGVVMIPSVLELAQDGNRTTAKVEVSFLNVDSPTDCLKVIYYGYGIDSQDKGVGKAISYAVKYCLLKMFCLESGDDVEKDNIEYKPGKITPSQVTFLQEMIDGDESLESKVLNFSKVKTLEDVPSNLFKNICEKLKQKQNS